jgi:hypothetical protein
VLIYFTKLDFFYFSVKRQDEKYVLILLVKESMMKKFGLILAVLLLAVSPAVAVTQIIDGQTSQCWDFDEEGAQYGIIGAGNNPYGDPVAIINDLSISRDLEWSGNYGGWQGSDFLIVLDIPNSPENGPDTYKTLDITITYTGELATFWAVDAETQNIFTPVGEATIEYGEVWTTFTQQLRVEPNPRKEVVFIGLKGVAAPAAIDQICVTTQCIPEPMTLVLLAAGGFFALRKKHS